MAYRLIKGEFIVFNPVAPASGPQPDGDTIKFHPTNPALVEGLHRIQRPPDFNASSHINVRFEGIDALETHFEGAAQAQPRADRARAAMLTTVGFTAFRPLASFPSRLEHAEPSAGRTGSRADRLAITGRRPSGPSAVTVDRSSRGESTNAAVLAVASGGYRHFPDAAAARSWRVRGRAVSDGPDPPSGAARAAVPIMRRTRCDR